MVCACTSVARFVIETPGQLETLLFPKARGLKRVLYRYLAVRALTRRFRLSRKQNEHDEAEARRVADLALGRLGGLPQLFEERVTVADVTVAAMAAPLRATFVRDTPSIAELLDWSAKIMGPEITALYEP